MDLEKFKYLPSEIIIDILSTLPIRTIAICKCVCKSWLHLLRTREFVDLHLSKSEPGLVIGRTGRFYHMFEFVDKIASYTRSLPTLPYGNRIYTHGSINGLLLLSAMETLYICNPITREYIDLPNQRFDYVNSYVTCGFGMSKLCGGYFLSYCNKNKTRIIKSNGDYEVNMGRPMYTCNGGYKADFGGPILHTSSFLSLGSFPMENVRHF